MNATFGGHERILYIWHSDKPVADYGKVIEADVEALNQAVQNGDSVQVENSDRLDLAAYPASSFDAVVIRMFSLMSVDACAIALKLLKCGGTALVLFAGDGATYDQIVSNLRLSGFSGFEQIPQQSRDLEIRCKKPSFEVGASSKLKFATGASVGLPSTTNAAKPVSGGMWSLNTNDTIEDDLVTEDELLTVEDFVKPNPATLKVSGCSDNAAAGAPKKACKNCTCGLAEELAGVTTAQPKSACGSCYLGDAFRCSSCPYLGLPAFKPGQEVKLTPQQMRSDLSLSDTSKNRYTSKFKPIIMPSADADLPAESSTTTANSHSPPAKKGPMAFLRDLPTLNSANFSKFSHDSIVLQQSPSNKSIVTQSRSDEDSIPIVTEKTSIMLRYLHRAWEKKKDEAASKKRAIAEIDSDSPGPSNAGLSGEPRRKMPRTS